MCFTNPAGRRIAVRQVYPAEIALARRGLEAWVRSWPFRERRRYRADGGAEVWQSTAAGEGACGVLVRGRKRFAAPLGGCASRHSCAAGLAPASLGRVCVAEVDHPARFDMETLAEVLRDMRVYTADTEPKGSR
jgi:hypothetical protein